MSRFAYSTIAATCLALCILPASTSFAQPERRTPSAAERAERAADFGQSPVERGSSAADKLDKLSLTGQAVTFEIVIAEFVKGGKGPAAVDLEVPDKVLPKLKALEAAGDIGALTRFNLSAVELAPARIQIGERRPVVTARGGFAGRAPGVVEGPVSYSMENVGTLVSALSRVTSDGSVVAEIAVERTRPALAPAKGSETEIARTRSSTTSMQATVLIPPGQWVVLGGAQGSAEEESSQTIVLVSAKASEPANRGAAQIKMFPLVNAKAPELAKVVTSVTSDRGVRVSVDERTNTLIVTGNRIDLEVVEALVLRLDEAK